MFMIAKSVGTNAVSTYCAVRSSDAHVDGAIVRFLFASIQLL